MSGEPVNQNPDRCVERDTFQRPELKRLGTLAELTAGMTGLTMDGGSGMSKFP